MAKRALLIGINKYQHAKKLRGCVNDVLDVSRVLTAKFGFPAANIAQLTDEAATRPGIIAAVKQLIKDTKKDDIIVFYYSGHGSFMQAVRDDEPDRWNETIMPVESSHKEGGKNTDICDDEILGFIQQLGVKTSYTTLIFDCCHSGSLARNVGDDDGARRAEGDTRDLATLRAAGYEQPSAQPSVAGKGKGGLLPVSDKYVMLAACLDGEIAREKTFKVNNKNVRRGLFTYMLCRQLERASTGSTYLDVFERASIRTTLFNKTQHPQLEGRFNRKLFGMSEIEPMNYDLIGAPQDKNGKKVVQIESGVIHGTDVGDVWEIYGRGTKQDDTNKVYGRAEALTVTPRHSEAKILPAKTRGNPRANFCRLSGRQADIYLRRRAFDHLR